MSTWDKRYTDRVQLLVEILPMLAREPRFALKGRVDGHGDHLRFSWTLGPSGAEDLIEGTDFAQLEAGKLHAVTGFLDKVPAAA